MSHIDGSHHRCIDEDEDTTSSNILSSSPTAWSQRIPRDRHPNPNRDEREEYQDQDQGDGANISEAADKPTLTTNIAVEDCRRYSYSSGLGYYKNPMMIGSTLPRNNASQCEAVGNGNGSGFDNKDDADDADDAEACNDSIDTYAIFAPNDLDGRDPPKFSYSYLRLRRGIRRWASALRGGRSSNPNPNSIGGTSSFSAGTGASIYNSSSDVVFQPLDQAPSGEYELI
jgi:hypothetical protein